MPIVQEQLNEINYNGSIISASGSLDPTILNMPESNGVYITAPIIYNPNFHFAQETMDLYESTYNKPFGFYSANGYDCIKLIVNLLEDQEITRSNIQSILDAGFIHPGIFGTIDVKAGEHDFNIPLHPAKIVDGRIEYFYP